VRIIFIPLVVTEHLAGSPFPKVFFKSPVQDDIIFAVIADPALVAMLVVLLLLGDGLLTVEDVIQPLMVNVP